MRRREFITLLGGAAATTWPQVPRAQQAGKLYRIGILQPAPRAQDGINFDELLQGLLELGYIEGQNLVIEFRSADGRDERFPDLVTELIRLNVDLIVTRGTPAALAAKNATRTIPIVMAAIGDPVENGVIASLARPGANVTGLSASVTELQAKRLELLKELVPRIARMRNSLILVTPMNNLKRWSERRISGVAVKLPTCASLRILDAHLMTQVSSASTRWSCR
jgi:putative ABC transport system substrate-binding protein